jgi:hypothetical protein
VFGFGVRLGRLGERRPKSRSAGAVHGMLLTRSLARSRRLNWSNVKITSDGLLDCRTVLAKKLG